MEYRNDGIIAKGALLSRFSFECFESFGISLFPEAGKMANADVFDDRNLSELFPGVNVTQMYLHRWYVNRSDGVSESIRIVRKGARIDNNTIYVSHSTLNFVD